MRKTFGKICVLCFIYSFLCFAFAQTIESSSSIDWTSQTFESNISLDLIKAGIKMPSGRNAAVERITMQIPLLVKDSLLSIRVNSFTTLGDLVSNGTITLEELSTIIDNGKKTPSYFSNVTNNLELSHIISLNNISKILISHNYVYQPKKPLDRIASRPYSGIIIDARGSLPVHGEFVADSVEPCLFPQIWNMQMDLLYEKNMVEPQIVSQQGIVNYVYSDDSGLYQDRVGKDPLRIKARQVYGTNRTDPVISDSDALRILTVPENLELLRQGKVVIILDKDRLVHDIKVPLKNDSYYFAFDEINKKLTKDNIASPPVDRETGIMIAVENIQFQPDSAEILPSETERLNEIAEVIKNATKSNTFSIMVEGHTARIGDVNTELPLSIARAKTIVDEMIKRGIPEEMFTYKGYGGNVPVADNDTPEGRAKNRRVQITLQPVFEYSTWY